MAHNGCAICNELGPGELIELDLILADPLRWPATIWGIFSPPQGGMPASYRRFGAMKMGEAWLKEAGYDFSKAQLRKHITYDVPTLDTDPDAMIARGLIAAGEPGHSRPTLAEPIDPLAYVRYYNKGIELGIQGLNLLTQRVAKLIAAHERDPINEPDIPLALIKAMVDAGSKLATSQAAIVAAGKRFGDNNVDENEGFRGGDEVGPKLGHHRVRTIAGETRPVADNGMADRAKYNERARQDASPPIGGR